MEYIKLIGAALVVLAGAGFGACPVHKMKERTRELEGTRQIREGTATHRTIS